MAKKVQRSLQLPLWKPSTSWRPPEEMPSLSTWKPKRIAIDVETRDPRIGQDLGSGVRHGGYIVGLALGIDQGPRFYFPIRHEGSGNMDPKMVMGWARDELNNFEGEVVGANILYDLDYLAEEGVTFNKVKARDWHDVLLAEPMLDEHKRGKYNLDAVSVEHLGEGKDEEELRAFGLAYGWKTAKEVKSNIWRLSGPEAGTYGEGDVDRPLRILPEQIRKLELDEQLHCYDLERELTPCLLAMRRRGFRVNLNKVDRADGILKKEIHRWTAAVRRIAGPKADVNSVATLAPALRARGLELSRTKPSKTYPGGQDSVDKSFLEKNQGDELVDAIAAARRVSTLKSLIIDGAVGQYAIGESDGYARIHPAFVQVKGDDSGTVGPRFACTDPNAQQWPAREGEWDDDIDLGAGGVVELMRGFVEPDEGEVYQGNDYSQIEYRLLAHFAVGQGAEAARQAYRDDPKTDFHKLCATMLGVDPEDKVRRKRVKNTNFAKGYGAQYRKLATTFNCSEDEAKAFVEEYDQKIPFSKATLERAAQWAQKRGYVVTLGNRKARFPFWVPSFNGRDKQPLRLEEARKRYGRYMGDEWVPDRLVRAKDYVALNRKLQGSAGEIMKFAMRDAWRAGLCEPGALGAFLLTVHDELGSSVPRTKRGDEAGRELKRLMENVVRLKVPIVAESERGPNWGALKGENDSGADPGYWDFERKAA